MDDTTAASRKERVLETVRALEQAWAAGDPVAFGALHSVTASYVAFDGTMMNGPHEIAEGHRALFAGIMKGSQLVAVERTIRLLGTDAAIVVQRAGIVMSWQHHRAIPSRKRLSTNTTLFREVEGDWKVETFQNTRYQPWSKTLIGRVMTVRPK